MPHTLAAPQSRQAQTKRTSRLAAGNVPVLVLGGGITAMGVVRSLGRLGIPRICVTADCPYLSASRWYQPLPASFGAPPRTSELAAFLSNLPIANAVLMACADDWLEAVANLPAKLREAFPSSICSADSVEVCVDKWRFAEMLKANSVPHPATQVLRNLAEMRALPDVEYLGCFLKPIASLEFGRKHGVKAFLVNSKADALARMVQPGSSSDFPIMLQEYVPGPPTNHYFVDGFVNRDGQISALFARQRIRMYPPLLGNSTLMVTVGLDRVEGAVRSLRTIVPALNYRGIISAEFKYDDRDGQFKILEVNARPWWYVEFASMCKVDVVGMTYRDALELPVEPISGYKEGVRCVYLSKDYKAYRHERNGKGGLIDWVRSWAGARETVFSWDDPRPAFAYLSEVASNTFKQVRGR